MTEPQIPGQVQARADWSAAGRTAVTHVNQFAITMGPPTRDGIPDGIYLALGNIAPPIIIGDDETRQKTIDAIKESGLQVDVYGHYHLSRERLTDLIEALQQTVKNYDAMAMAARSDEETSS